MERFHLSARVSSERVEAVRPVLQRFLGPQGVVVTEGSDLVASAELLGSSARELNRSLLSSLRKVEKRTRLRAEWTAKGTSERFFDYVPKGRRPAETEGARSSPP